MALSILNNIPSLVAQNQLAVTNSKLQNTLFQLSSGSKINSGADDPAGLSIANGLQANIMALTQSTQNVTNGVGMLQTADGALSQVTTLLNRAVTLATEAGNTGLTSSQSAALQTEFTSITNEINQIGGNTTYNNTQVFTANPVSVFLSDGSGVDEANALNANTAAISVTMAALSASSLGLGTYATGTIDLQSNPQAGNTVTIGTQSYTFATSAGAANTVALGANGNVAQTLQNLMSAVNNGPNGTGSGSAYGTGTTANTSATITDVNGGSATVQALTAGAITTIALNTFLTSVAGSSSANMNGGKAAVNATGTLSFTSANQPHAITAASGTLTLTGTVTAGNTVVVGANTYTFVAAGTASTAGSVSLDTNGSLTNDLNNLANAITGGAGNNPLSAGASTYYASDPVTAGVTATVSGNTMTIASTAAGTAGNATTAFTATISNSNGAVTGTSAGQLAGGAAADTVNVGGTTYTFVAAGTASTANSVALGGSINSTLNNLATVVTSGANGAPANAEASMTVVGNTATITAAGSNVLYAGTLGNSVALVSSAGGASGATLAGGAQATAATGTLTIGSNPMLGDTVSIAGTSYTFVASGNATAANQVAIANTLASTLANLKAAVNTTGQGDAAALANGTTFGIGTGQNTAVSIGTANGSGAMTVTALVPAAGNSYGNGLVITANLAGGAGGAVGTGFLTGGTAAASLLSTAGAQLALASITTAISTVASQRGAIGSGINQMNAAVQVMNNTSQNLAKSLSGVQDADIGQVVANMSKFQVLEQTGISALAQSNQQEQAVLKLLQ